MVSIKFLVCMFVLFATTFAANTRRTIEVLPVDQSGFEPAPSPKAKHGKIIAITDELIPITRQEESEFALESSESGFGRVTRVGISVTRGASALLNFDITVTAVDAETIDRNDASFVETLSSSERVEYASLKEDFRGGLNIPLLSWIGANLETRVTREDLVSAAELQTNYDAKSQAVSELLESAADTRIRINGTLRAEGISFRPTTAFAFIQLARVEFEDGSSQLVVSNDPQDVVAADRQGNEVDSSEQEVDVSCAAGFFC